MVGTPANGIVVINADQTLTYTPKAGFVGTDTFTYTASDGSATSNAATVAISVLNQAPVAANDNASTNQGKPVAIPVLSNDQDPDGDPISVTGVSAPTNGSVVLSSNGIVTYTPKAGFVGTDTFTYQATDGASVSAAATVTVVVNAATNTAPVATNDLATASKGALVTISVLANDTDADNDPLTVTGLTSPTAGGTVVLNPSGTVSYTPKSGFVGTDTFTYQATDGAGVSNVATVTVQVVNRTPVAVNDTASTRTGVAMNISVLANDSDADKDPLTVTGLTEPTSGAIVLNANGTITYTPKKGFTGTDTFTYKASDGLAKLYPGDRHGHNQQVDPA